MQVVRSITRSPSPKPIGVVLVWLLAVGVAGAVEVPWSGGGPDLGWVVALLEVEGVGEGIYAGTVGGGIFRSQDGGLTWADATSNARDAVVWRLRQGDDVLRTLYAASEDRILLMAPAGQTFWTPMGSQPTSVPLAGFSVTTFPGQELRIGLGTQNGVFVSRNRGVSWPDTLAYLPGNLVQELVVTPEKPNTIFAVTPQELVVTANVGQSIQQISAGLPPDAFLVGLEAWPGSADSLLAADLRGRIFQLHGDRFEEVGPSPVPGRMYVVEVDPSDRSLWAGADRGLYRRASRDEPWQFGSGGLGRDLPEVWSILPDGSGGAALGTFSSGFVRVAGDGSDWVSSNAGLRAAWVRSLAAWGDEVLAGTAHGRIFHSADAGVTWLDVTGDLQVRQLMVAHRVASADRWIVSGTEGVRRSEDRGGSWLPVALSDNAARFVDLRARATDDDRLLVGLSARGLHVSDDGGVEWSLRAHDLPVDRRGFALATHGPDLLVVGFDPPTGGSIPTLHVGAFDSTLSEIVPPPAFRGRPRAVCFLDERTLLVGAHPSDGSALYRIDDWSDPVARTFTDLEGALGRQLPLPTSLCTVGRSVLLGLAEGGVLRSEDGGVTWRSWSEGLSSERIEALAVREGSPHRMYAGTLARGVFGREVETSVPVLLRGLSARAHEHGVRLRVELSEASVLRVRRVSPASATIFEGSVDASTEFDDDLAGIARPRDVVARWVVEEVRGSDVSVLGELTRALDELLPSLRTRLLPVHPNPFNPRTTVRWEQQRPGRVRVEVFDVRGRLVRRLLDRELEPGARQIDFDGFDERGAPLASGVYLLKVWVDDRVLTGRMTLVR